MSITNTESDEVSSSTTRRAARHNFAIALWICGGLMIASAVLHLSLLLGVPLFGMQNARWLSPDNPISLHAAILYLNVGTLCILAAKSRPRLRLVLVSVALATFICLGTRDLGIVAW